MKRPRDRLRSLPRDSGDLRLILAELKVKIEKEQAEREETDR